MDNNRRTHTDTRDARTSSPPSDSTEAAGAHICGDGRHRQSASNRRLPLVKTYEREGLKGLQAKARGFDSGHWRTLDMAQAHAIQGLLVEKTPDQLKRAFAL